MTWHRVENWPSLDGVHERRPDPYVVWAELTDWADLLGFGTRANGRGHPIPLLVELKADCIAEFRRAFEGAFGEQEALLSPVYEKGRFLTAWVPPDRLKDFVDPKREPGNLVERFDLCMPVRPGRNAKAVPDDGQTKPRSARQRLSGSILMGVVDSGCPFAHHKLVQWSGNKVSTRLAMVWDMRHRSVALFGSGGFAVKPKKMLYGLEAVRDGAKGIDAWLSRFQVAPGTLDEEASYASAGYRDMRSRVSHGAHVLDVMAGRVSLRNRICVDPDAPPAWAVSNDAASNPEQSDIAFVQLPRGALQDSSGGWLGSHILDAVNYLVQAARKQRHVVINISYGCTVGPHDGSSILEQALDDMVSRSQQPGTLPKVHLVVAAGNSFSANGHVVLRPKDFHDGESKTVVWRILPNSEAPNFVQFWFPKISRGQRLTVRIAPPSGDAVELGLGKVAVWPMRKDPQATAVFVSASSRGNDAPMLLVAVSPTENMQDDRYPAPHGDWTLTVCMANPAHLAPNSEIHAYIARNDHDIGTLQRGRQSFFVDECDEPLRYLRGCADDPGMLDEEIDNSPERADALIRRRGTLNGIATGKHVRVAAGYELRRMVHAPYSSAGKTGSKRGRGPNSALMTDESGTLRGVRAAGNSSAGTFRLIGTSSAAPQRARKLVNELVKGPPSSVPLPPPSPGQVKDPADLLGSGEEPVTVPPAES